MTAAATYESPEYGTLNTIRTDGGIWYFGKAIANALRMRDWAYRKSLKGISRENIRRAEEFERYEDPVMKNWVFVSEEGAEKLIRDAEDQPRAVRFREWVRSQTHPEGSPAAEPEETATRALESSQTTAMPDTPILKFASEKFGEIRVIEIEGDPWFVGKDVAEVLGYGDTDQALRRHVFDEDKLTRQFDGSGQNREMTTINESGLYSLIMSSKLPAAREFKRWVTSEVLPSIRKHGLYATEELIERTISDPEYIIRILTEMKEEKEKNKQLTERNEALAAANDILAENTMIWNDRAVLNALVRAYSIRAYNGDFVRGWRAFYRAVQYELGINLKNRKAARSGGGLIETITKEEFPEVVKLAVAVCQHVNLDPGKIINDVNAERCEAAAAV